MQLTLFLVSLCVQQILVIPAEARLGEAEGSVGQSKRARANPAHFVHPVKMCGVPIQFDRFENVAANRVIKPLSAHENQIHQERTLW
jgi:hypothetical protein